MRLLLPLLLLAACAKSVIPEYDARKAAVMAAPAEVPARWAPDAALTLTPGLVDDLITAALDKARPFDRKIEIAGARTYVHPALNLDALDISAAPDCEACLRLATTLSGQLSWQVGNSSGSRPLTGSIVLDAELGAERREEGWVVTLAPRKVVSAELDMKGGAFRTVRTFAEGTLSDWTRRGILEQLQPLVVARLDSNDLPLRAARARPHDAGFVVEMLSIAPVVERVEAPTPRSGETWALALSRQVVLYVARREAFQKGALAYDVAVEPVDIDLKGGTFSLDARLWRLKGKGWWRDYRVTGTWNRTAEGFDLVPVEADERGHSKGAKLGDPLATLAEGRILQAVERAVATTVPGGTQGLIGSVPIQAEVGRIGGEQTALLAGGTAHIGTAGGKPKSPRRVNP